MTEDDRVEFANFVAVLASEAKRPECRVVASDAVALVKLAKAIKRRAIRECNYGYASDAAAERGAEADERDYSAAQDIADRYDATVLRMGDVRGYAIKLRLPSDKNNTWGGAGEGYGVPD